MTLVAIGSPAAPPQPFHVIGGDDPLLFVPATSAVYAIDPQLAEGLQAGCGDAIAEAGGLVHRSPAKPVAAHPEPLAISLNIVQACNLSCTYCYADEGRFGGGGGRMPLPVALSAIDRLLAAPGKERVSVGFIGGEPLLNRPVLHAATHYAARAAAALGRPISFGITTNGTLLEPDDLELFRAFPFGVTVSLDGGREANDLMRRARQGSAFLEATSRMRPLLAEPGRARVAARATLTRQDYDVAARIRALADAGFTEIGVSPLRTSPDPALAFRPGDWAGYLACMRAAAAEEWRRVRQGASGFRFSNLAIALRQIHRGDVRRLPCGAADTYVSVSAAGEYFTCHRTIADPRFALGDAVAGPSRAAREAFIQARQVDSQEPCRSCWARYLCGGGCHAEVVRAGREGCDFIRGWLEHCIGLYPRVLAERPDLLAPASKEAA